MSVRAPDRYYGLIAVLPRLLRAHPVAEATGYVYEDRLRGLDEPAKAGFAAKSRGLQPLGFNNLGRLAITGQVNYQHRLLGSVERTAFQMSQHRR